MILNSTIQVFHAVLHLNCEYIFHISGKHTLMRGQRRGNKRTERGCREGRERETRGSEGNKRAVRVTRRLHEERSGKQEGRESNNEIT